ncbi:MAG: queuosine precursor transporter [Candidatus Jidaibacter sp.]|jgi:uncharacterized integral membrane protein (TIGR00697 family)|nr:queuosine precursor transporter [Candidatus Jidaibacter sp.]
MSEILSIFLLLFCFGSILLLWKLWQELGLYLYNILAIIIANIQVLKVSPFIISSEPIALGTVLFATTFTVSDILTEHFGPKSAQMALKLSFTAQVLMTAFMMITLIYPSAGSDIKGLGEDGLIIDPVQYAMFILFMPSVRLLAASLIAYFISQMLDIYLFKLIKDLTHKKFLWLRFNVANMVSGLVDNIIFSVLAWVLLNPNPVTLHTLVFTYILGTYAARVLVSITSTPVIYLTHRFKR